MAETDKKAAFVADEAPVEEAKVEETVDAPKEETPEVVEPTVQVALAKDYDGPKPVFVSTPDENGREFKVEVTDGAEVPEKFAEAVSGAAFIEVTE